MSTANEIINWVAEHRHTGIKAGSQRAEFLNIWMVVVNKRIFVRSWGLAERSWYNTFLDNPTGYIKCGANEVEIKAVIPGDLEHLQDSINEAYLKKYDSGEGSYYAQRMILKERMNKTMELVLQLKPE